MYGSRHTLEDLWREKTIHARAYALIEANTPSPTTKTHHTIPSEADGKMHPVVLYNIVNKSIVKPLLPSELNFEVLRLTSGAWSNT